LNRYYDLLVFELFDDEYYRNLEMWVRYYSRLLEMIPFESIGTVSYLTSIGLLTMAVSLTISEIIKERPDLEIWVWGPSVSLKIARFDRTCTTLY